MVYIIKNKADLDKKIEEAGEKLVVIDFFATWCGPCKVIAPKLEELSGIYAEKATMVKVDVDECEDIAAEYNVSSMPTFVFIKRLKVVHVFAGGNADKLTKSVEKYVNEEPAEEAPAAPPAAAAAAAAVVAAVAATTEAADSTEEPAAESEAQAEQ